MNILCIQFPVLKKRLYFLLALIVLLTSASCSVTACFADSETVTFTVDGIPGEQIVLTVRKNVCTPVLKEVNEADTTVLYGTIYPYSTALTQKDSFAADVLQTLYCGADDSISESQKDNFLMRFNWQRFMEECRSYEEPWLLDKEKIMKAIASGSFKASDIKLK